LARRAQTVVDPDVKSQELHIMKPMPNDPDAHEFLRLWGEVPRFPTVADSRVVKVLFPLYQAMNLLYKIPTPDCAIEDNIWKFMSPSMRPFTNIVPSIHNRWMKMNAPAIKV
jgi:hypothetical protein